MRVSKHVVCVIAQPCSVMQSASEASPVFDKPGTFGL